MAAALIVSELSGDLHRDNLLVCTYIHGDCVGANLGELKYWAGISLVLGNRGR